MKIIRLCSGIAIGALSIALAGCSLFSHSQVIHPPTKLQPIDKPLTVKELWNRSTGDGADDQYLKLKPFFTDKAVITVDWRGGLKAFDFKHNGKRLWRKAFDVKVTTGVDGSSNTVFIGTDKGDVIAASSKDGTERWRKRLSSEVTGISGVDLGAVVVRTNDSKLYALDAESGKQLWRVNHTAPRLTLRGTSAPIVAGDKVIVGFDDGKLDAYSLSTGRQLWEKTISVGSGPSEIARLVDIDGRMRLDNGIIYVAGYQGNVAAVILDGGQLLWSRDLPSHEGLDVDDRYVYVTDDDSNVWALDKDSGSSVWKQDKLKYRDLTAPTVTPSGHVVVGDGQGYLHWLAGADGHRLARTQIDSSGILSAPIAHGDDIYAQSRGGELAALKTIKPKNKPAGSKQ